MELPHGSNDEIGPADIFSQVMGPERSGRLRMCGGGVAPSDIWADTPTRGTQQLFMAEQRNKIQSLEEQVKEQGRLLAEIRAQMSQNTNISNQSRAGSLESNRQTTPTNNSLRELAVRFLFLIICSLT
jgi:hypothetical protein